MLALTHVSLSLCVFISSADLPEHQTVRFHRIVVSTLDSDCYNHLPATRVRISVRPQFLPFVRSACLGVFDGAMICFLDDTDSLS